MWRFSDAALDSIGDAVLCTDTAGSVTYLNRAAETMTGWTRASATGRPLRDVFHIVDGDTRAPAPDPMSLALERNQAVGLTPNCRLVRRDGREVAIEDSAAPIHDSSGLAVGAVIVFRDVGEALRRSREALQWAQHDALTQLPNRALLNDFLDKAIALGRRHERSLAVGFLDVDGLKAVNDSSGHRAGDLILSGVASRIRAALRQSDSVGRVGGDEFVIVFSEIAHAEDAALVGRKVLQSIAAPHRVDGRDVTVTASLGLALYPHDGLTAEALIAGADVAMYVAKRDGGGTCRFFQPGMTLPSAQYLAAGRVPRTWPSVRNGTDGPRAAP